MPPVRLRPRLAAGLLAVALTSGCATALAPARFDGVTVHARGDSREIDAFAASITTALAAIGGALDLPIPAAGLAVYRFDSPREMKRYLRQHCPEQSEKAAACFAAAGGYTVAVVRSSQPGRTDRLLRHELTHYLLASRYRDLPRWIDEGLAQYLEDDPSQPRGEKRKEFRKRKLPRAGNAIVDLISLPAQQALDKEQYILSWALVSFLMQEERLGLERIKSYLADVEADGKELQHFESVFGSVAELRPRWESFLAREGLDDSR